MKSDIEIAQGIELKPIAEIAASLGLSRDDLIPYGRYVAKIPISVMDRYQESPDGKVILVTAMSPTSMGEGKTTTTIGLGQALNQIGKKAIMAIREPSLGPCMGLKGGAAGGGYSQVLPMEDINLHFTGDFHAITSAHNLLAAVVDNHLHHRHTPEMNPRHVVWKRVIDMNDRSLRSIILGLEDKGINGVMREDGFEITAASEVMAILCLAQNLKELKTRINKVIVGYDYLRKPVYAKDVGCSGAMTALLKHAINPNLVQTVEGCPVLVHGGPVRQHRTWLQHHCCNEDGAQARRLCGNRGRLRGRSGGREVLPHQVPHRQDHPFSCSARGHTQGLCPAWDR